MMAVTFSLKSEKVVCLLYSTFTFIKPAWKEFLQFHYLKNGLWSNSLNTKGDDI